MSEEVRNSLEALEIGCERCGALPGSGCRSPRGATTRHPHLDRLIAFIEALSDITLSQREPRALEAMVLESVAAASWLEHSDEAKIGLARSLARSMDDAIHRAEMEGATLLDDEAPLAEVGKALAYMGGELGRMLDALGCSPKGRMELGILSDNAGDDPLATIRALTPTPLAGG